MHDQFDAAALQVLGKCPPEGVVADLAHEPRRSAPFGIQSRDVGRASTAHSCRPDPVVEPPARHAGQHNEDVLQKVSHADEHIANLVYAQLIHPGFYAGSKDWSKHGSV